MPDCSVWTRWDFWFGVPFRRDRDKALFLLGILGHCSFPPVLVIGASDMVLFRTVSTDLPLTYKPV